MKKFLARIQDCMLFKEMISTNKLMNNMLFSFLFLENKMIVQNKKPCKALINKKRLKISLTDIHFFKAR